MNASLASRFKPPSPIRSSVGISERARVNELPALGRRSRVRNTDLKKPPRSTFRVARRERIHASQESLSEVVPSLSTGKCAGSPLHVFIREGLNVDCGIAGASRAPSAGTRNVSETQHILCFCDAVSCKGYEGVFSIPYSYRRFHLPLPAPRIP